ncbi:MAG TPA: PQQ-binding-like beta-propeller repeat protein, partial [Candidatus Nanoarchaeia archaeon]|nr:PQQ-binding-like beta-propeller repeat protein [Candidatus Nanoarchaeia archaeon]
LQVWSTSQVYMSKVPNANDYWMYRPYMNYTFNGANGFLLNASIPTVQGNLIDVRQDQFIIGGLIGTYDASGNVQTPGNLWCLSLKAGQQGTLLWNITFTPPSQVGNKTISMTSVDPEDGVIIFSCTQTMQYWGYSLATGNLIWGPTAPAEQFDYYGMSTNIYQGMLLACGYGGVLRAYNITTGKLLWTYAATAVGFESFYGGYYPLGIVFIADGKIYTTSSEHSPTQPLWRGSDLRCINASNGAELWKCLFWGMGMASGSGAAIADGYIVGLNAYDNQIYCFGKGPSGTTVEAPMTAITVGTTAVIRGTVTDQSVGAIALAQKEGMMNGVAAVNDNSMEAWMEYLYEGQVKPTNATGVPVSIDSIDPNGNTVHLGDAVSDSNGLYSLAWTPPDVPGKYTVVATFAGSNSFYSSQAETALYVGQAPPAAASAAIKPTAPPTPTTTITPTTAPTITVAPTPSPVIIPPTNAAPTATYIAIGLAIVIIIAAAAAFALRRRK